MKECSTDDSHWSKGAYWLFGSSKISVNMNERDNRRVYFGCEHQSIMISPMVYIATTAGGNRSNDS